MPQLVQANFVAPLASPSAPAPADLYNEIALWLGESSTRHKVAVHGWLLADDRILLLATPSDETGLPRLMQTLGRNLAARLRGGRIFAGRYRSALTEPGAWVLPALVWLETFPARAVPPQDPETWPWSSASGHTGGARPAAAWVADHADYWACGNTPFDRQANYRRRLSEGLSREDIHRIDRAVMGQWALGGADYIAGLSATASRRVAPGKRGRPRKPAAADHAPDARPPQAPNPSNSSNPPASSSESAAPTAPNATANVSNASGGSDRGDGTAK
jgi:putative transposase